MVLGVWDISVNNSDKSPYNSVLLELTSWLGRQTTNQRDGSLLYIYSLPSPPHPRDALCSGGPHGLCQYTLLFPTSSHWVQPMRGTGKEDFYSSSFSNTQSIIPSWVYICIQISIAAYIGVFLSSITVLKRTY